MAPSVEEEILRSGVSATTIAYITMSFTVLIMAFIIMCIKVNAWGQKTRNPQQRRMYMGTRARPSLGQTDPPIYVSPSNLPPPPKYECMAPPSYEEVVGVHYPNYPVQPITQPITAAMAQSTSSNETSNTTTETTARTSAPETVITVPTEPKRPSAPVAQS